MTIPKARPKVVQPMELVLVTAIVALPLLLIGGIPLLLKIAFHSIAVDVFQVWKWLFIWSGETFLRFLPTSLFKSTFAETLEAGNLVSIAAANLIPFIVVSAILYFIFVRTVRQRIFALGLAVLWSVFVIEAIGAVPYSIFGFMMSAWHHP